MNPLRVQRVTIVDHPAVADRLARARDRATPTPSFRRAVEEMGVFLAYEATRGLALEDVTVETPVSPAAVRRLATRPVVAPILRAGLGLLPGFLSVIDDAVVARIWGFSATPRRSQPCRTTRIFPADLSGRAVFALDPMLATGNSGAAALDVLTARGATDVSLLCILAAPEGNRVSGAPPPERAHLHVRARRPLERARVHRARARRRGRPHVRERVVGAGGLPPPVTRATPDLEIRMRSHPARPS